MEAVGVLHTWHLAKVPLHLLIVHVTWGSCEDARVHMQMHLLKLHVHVLQLLYSAGIENNHAQCVYTLLYMYM